MVSFKNKQKKCFSQLKKKKERFLSIMKERKLSSNNEDSALHTELRRTGQAAHPKLVIKMLQPATDAKCYNLQQMHRALHLFMYRRHKLGNGFKSTTSSADPFNNI